MCAEPISLARCALAENPERIVTVHAGRIVNAKCFAADVAGFTEALRQQDQTRYALYYEDAYPFAVMLFALWHAGKRIFIPGNNRPATADYLTGQDCRLIGEWQGKEQTPVSQIGAAGELEALDLTKAQLTIFTSGSSGEPKAIAKTLLQLQREVETLEAQWGSRLGLSIAAATVSHQHIYGLLFRLLWPLATGRCFHSQMFLSPEPMLKVVAGQRAYWVASPAQLKRLDELTAWDRLAELATIFSSGGPLPLEAARQIEQGCGQRVIEVYGSSETGGIAWRCATQDARWMPFTGVELNPDESGRCMLSSPHLANTGSYPLDDRIELDADGRFSLAGRLDRIVKVEEKRLSLDELERKLSESEWIALAHSLLLTNRRDRIGAAIVLTESGLTALRQQGRAAVIKRLRHELEQAFESVVLPRKWLFLNTLPLTRQGKIDNALLRRLLMPDSVKYPQLLYCRLEGTKVDLELRIQPELVYFEGHFPGIPILPGVTQLAWTEHYGKLFFAIEQPFLTMEAIKFKKIILPNAAITMRLEWHAGSGKLCFDLSSATESHSSGRMIYGAQS